MLSGCHFHYLESLIQNYQNCDVRRLEYMSAWKVMSTLDIAKRLLPVAPASLFPLLFGTAVQEAYHRETLGQVMLMPASIMSVIEHWPQPRFVLKEVMPKLPLQHSKLSYRDASKILAKFLHELVIFLLTTFLKHINSVTPSQYPELLDISGFAYVVLENIDMHGHQRFTRHASGSRREIVLDVLCDQFVAVKTTVNLAAQNDHSLVRLKWRQLRFSSLPFSRLTNLLDYTEDATVLEIDFCDTEPHPNCDLPFHLQESLCGFSLSHSRVISFEFVKTLKNLLQLDLSGTELRGKLDFLSHLHQGLEFLRLVGCRLNEADLAHLLSSHHLKTLRQVDLSENTLSQTERFSIFISICQHLSQVEILELENCRLDSVGRPLLKQWVACLAESCPRLVLLQLFSNDFAVEVLNSDIAQVCQCSSLRCICLTVPSEMYLNDDYSINEQQIANLKSVFYEKITFQASPGRVQVNWKEEIGYSHWFYSTLR